MDTSLQSNRIDKRFVHKYQEENVLIGDIRRISTDPEKYECDMIVDFDHPYFFEHPLDHIPGLMFTEAGRQVGIALSHLFLDIPFGTQFISRELHIRFETFAELREPIRIISKVSNKKYRHGVLSEALLLGEFYQCGKLVCSLEGDWKMFSEELYHRYRDHQHITANSK